MRPTSPRRSTISWKGARSPSNARRAIRRALPPWWQRENDAGVVSSIEPRLERGRPERPVLDVLQGNGHDLARAVDVDTAKELQTFAGRQILSLVLVRCLDVAQLRAERVVENVGAKRTGMDRPGYEFPERLEILEDGLAGIVIVRRGVVHVGGKPYRVANPRMLDE